MSGLDLDTEYSVTVHIANGYGSGPLSDPVLARTLTEGGKPHPFSMPVLLSM